jgi:hypothetical protein
MSSERHGPPKSGQFLKGQSGNPGGYSKKPSAPVSADYLFRKVAYETIPLESSGRTVKMSRLEAVVRQVHIMALNGKPGAERLFHRIRKQFRSKAAPGDFILVVSENDMKL